MTRKRNRLSLQKLTDDVLFYSNTQNRKLAYEYVRWLVRSMNTDRMTIRAAVCLLRAA